LRAYVDARRPGLIDEAAFGELLRSLAPVSERYLRRLLRETDVPLAPLVEGIRQDSFDQLERTLEATGREYAASIAAGNAPRAQACRRAVIAAKDHARFALRRLAGDQRAARQEMVLWMLVWLENPGIFSAWLALRKRVLV
jgi:hypothetical protein